MNKITGKMFKILSITLLIILAQGLIFTFIHAQEQENKHQAQTAGCKTAYFLMRELFDDYKKRTDTKIIPQRVGNKVAIKLLIAGDIEFAFTCQPHEDLAKKLAINEEHSKNWRTIKFAKDPIVVVVNQSNKVTNLTKTQLTDIFTGKVTNWKDVGGDDLEIKLAYQDEVTESGVMTVFQETTVGRTKGVLGELSPNAVKFPGPKKRGAYISQNPGAITYMGLGAYREHYGKLLDIDGAAPTRENIAQGSYPITATYYIVYNENKKDIADPFLQYLTSDDGKDVINKNFLSDIE